MEAWKFIRTYGMLWLLLAIPAATHAQSDASVHAKIDAVQITVGDQIRVFLEAQHDVQKSKLTWAVVPDSFDHLEVVERGKIDTLKQGNIEIYKQRLLVTGFDSGKFTIPSMVFAVTPTDGATYNLQTDSFSVVVQTVPVDTTKPFKGIKGIFQVPSSWMDYLLYIIIAAVLIIAAILITAYIVRKRKNRPVVVPAAPVISLHDRTMRLFDELEAQQLWQAGKVKEYYTQLTDILRLYIEERFNTAAMELTTDELLHKARMRADMQPYFLQLEQVLHMADLAKFAKAQPLPEEHTAAMASARAYVNASKQTVTETVSHV